MSLYPLTRHIQRYEYLLEKGYVEGKSVLDIGCGLGLGTSMLACHATAVTGVDPRLKPYIDAGNNLIPTYVLTGRTLGKRNFAGVPWEQIDVEKTDVDVVVAIEIIEHLKNPADFLAMVAKITDNLFLTTPLAANTAPTNNPEHVVEYSHSDLVALVTKCFDILKTQYQTADLRVVDEATPHGSSIDPNHIVQMLWCKTKGAPK